MRVIQLAGGVQLRRGRRITLNVPGIGHPLMELGRHKAQQGKEDRTVSDGIHPLMVKPRLRPSPL
jgi:hypothetical protein